MCSASTIQHDDSWCSHRIQARSEQVTAQRDVGSRALSEKSNRARSISAKRKGAFDVQRKKGWKDLLCMLTVRFPLGMDLVIFMFYNEYI